LAARRSGGFQPPLSGSKLWLRRLEAAATNDILGMVAISGKSCLK
jgi:hypothetical protein